MGKAQGGVSDPGGEMADRTDTAEENRLDVEIHLGGGSKGGVRILDDGEINQAAPEHSNTVYCYAITVRPV